jgi:hypothetical protein
MILSRRFAIQILDLYFDEPVPALKVDIIRFNQFSTPVPGASRCIPVCTMLIDLSNTSEQILAKMHRTLRYQIRRASERDHFCYEYWTGQTSSEMISEFADYYDRHAYLKGLASVSRRRLALLAHTDVLDISLVRNDSGEILSAAAQLNSGRRVRNLQMMSSVRAHSNPSQRHLIGRAHHYMIWRDILRAREGGLKFFDFGGWYTGNTDPEKLRINHFKQQFGGEILQEFTSIQARTLKGQIASAAMSPGMKVISMGLAKTLRAAVARNGSRNFDSNCRTEIGHER